MAITEKEVSEEKLTELKLELKELQSKIRDLDLPSNRRQFARHTISDSDMELHRTYGERIRQIESIMSVNKKAGFVRMQEDHVFVDLMRETFGPDDYIKIMQEYNRRRKGETHIRVTVKHRQNKEGEYKIKLIKLWEQVKIIRQTLTEVNMNGCERFDMSEFMKIISPLNRMVPPIGEIDKTIKHL